MDGNALSDLGGLVLLGSWSLALPAAVLTVIALVFAGRSKPTGKARASLLAVAFSFLVGTVVIVALWGLRGDFEDPLMLSVLIPGAAVVAMLGALPAALVVRWLLNRRLPLDGPTGDAEAA